MSERIVAKIRRDSAGNWLVTFPDIMGAHTYGRSLSQLRRRIPEVLRLWDRDPDQVDIVEVVELPAALKQAVEQATRRRRELEVESRAVRRDLGRTLERLRTGLGLGVRDSGELLGISPQYAHKLRRGKGRTSKRRSGSRPTAVKVGRRKPEHGQVQTGALGSAGAGAKSYPADVIGRSGHRRQARRRPDVI